MSRIAIRRYHSFGLVCDAMTVTVRLSLDSIISSLSNFTVLGVQLLG